MYFTTYVVLCEPIQCISYYYWLFLVTQRHFLLLFHKIANGMNLSAIYYYCDFDILATVIFFLIFLCTYTHKNPDQSKKRTKLKLNDKIFVPSRIYLIESYQFGMRVMVIKMHVFHD